MASELAAYYVSIVPSAKGLAGKISREFAGVDQQAAKAGKSSGGAFSGAFKASMGGLAGLVAAVGIGKFVAEAARASDATDKFKKTMNFAGLKTDAIDKATKAAKQYADQTVYDLPTIQNMLAQLASNGVKDYTGLTKAAGNLNAVAGGNADTFKSVAMVMTQTAGAGKLTTENWNQLADAIPGAAGPLMKAMQDAGAYTGNFRDAMAKGQITSDEFNAALMKLGTKPVAVEAAKSTSTFEGALGNLAATINSGLMTALDAIKPAATTAISVLSDGLGKAFQWIGDAATGLYDMFAKGDFTAAFSKAFNVQEDSPLVDFLLRARDGAIGLHDLLLNGDYTGLLRKAFGWEEDSSAVDALLKIRDTAKELPGKFKEFRDAAFNALKGVGDWLVKNKDWLGALAISVGSVVAAYKTYTAALALHSATVAIYTAISSAAGGAQAFFAGAAFTAALGVTALNTALKANLFGIIALAVIGLVSGLVWFFTQTEAGKAIVAAAWDGIQKVVGGVVDWFTNTALPAIQSFVGGIVGFFEDLARNSAPAIDGVKSVVGGIASFFTDVVGPAIGAALKGVGDFFTWLYQVIVVPVVDGVKAYIGFLVAAFVGIYNFLKPVFDSLGVILGGFGMFFEGVFNLVVAYVQKILVPMFQFFWDRAVEIFSGIGAAVGNWWNGVVSIFNSVVSFIRDTLSAAFTWLYNNVIKPVFDAIGSAINWVWLNVMKPTFDVWVRVFTVVIPQALTWLRDYVVKPVFDGIGKAIEWVWLNVIKPTIDTWVYIFKNILGPAFSWLWKTIIKPAFDGIGSAIKWVWDNVVKPVFDTLNTFITKTIPKAFDQGVAAIKKAWDGIQEIAKAPVRFVINTVINDGLIKGFNDLARPLGVKELGRVALPAGFADGGYTGPGGKYQPAGIVHAGEYVFTKEQTQRAGVGNLAALANSLTGYARGGIVNPLKTMALTQGYNRIHKGIDLAASVGTPVFATESGRVSWAGPGVQAPGVWGGNEIHIDGGSGIQEWFAHLSSIGVKLGQMVRAGQQIGLSGNTGITSGPHLHFGTFNGGWPNDIDPLAYLGGAGIPSGGGFNPIAAIVDGLASKLKESVPGAGPFVDIAVGVGKKILDSASKFVTDFLSGNRDKGSATATLFDGGGWLHNTGGAQLIQHNKRKPDAVLSNEQWATMTRIAENSAAAQRGPGGFNNYGTIHVRDEHEMARLVLNKQRDAQAAYGF